MGSLSLLQRIFPIQGSNPGLPHGRWILYQLSHKGSPRILEWVAYPFSSRSPDPEIELWYPVLQADSLPAEPQGEPENTGVGSLSLLQQIFPTQESNWGLLCCRWILYQPSHQGSPECVHILATVSIAAMRIWMHVSFQIIVLSEYMPKSGIGDHMATPVLVLEESPYCFP